MQAMAYCATWLNYSPSLRTHRTRADSSRLRTSPSGSTSTCGLFAGSATSGGCRTSRSVGSSASSTRTSRRGWRRSASRPRRRIRWWSRSVAAHRVAGGSELFYAYRTGTSGLPLDLVSHTKPSGTSGQRNRDRCALVHYLAEVLNLSTEAVVGGKPDGPDVLADL